MSGMEETEQKTNGNRLDLLGLELVDGFPSSRGAMTSPLYRTRSGTSMRRCLGERAFGKSSRQLNVFSFIPRRISRMSRNPFVVIRPVVAPVWVSTVFVATVVPWTTSSTSPKKVSVGFSYAFAAFSNP
jgi:hypothetical protein